MVGSLTENDLQTRPSERGDGCSRKRGLKARGGGTSLPRRPVHSDCCWCAIFLVRRCQTRRPTLLSTNGAISTRTVVCLILYEYATTEPTNSRYGTVVVVSDARTVGVEVLSIPQSLHTRIPVRQYDNHLPAEHRHQCPRAPGERDFPSGLRQPPYRVSLLRSFFGVTRSKQQQQWDGATMGRRDLFLITKLGAAIENRTITRK